MIECTEKNIYIKGKRRKKSSRRFFRFIIFILIFSIIFCYYKFITCNLLFKICSATSYTYCTDSVNDAVLVTLGENIKHENIVNIERNESGDIVMLSLNSLNTNIISKNMVKNVRIILEEKIKNGIKIPLLALTGIEILSGYGKTINYKNINITSIYCEYENQFNSVGINQTLHSIYIKITCEINIFFPFNNKTELYENKILLCEAVLVGKVPEIYFNGKI